MTGGEGTSAGHTPGATRKSLLTVGVVFVISAFVMLSVFWNFPQLDEEDLQRLKLPLNIEDAKDLGRCLSKYKNSHYHTVLFAFFLTYIFLQTFAIPGSIFLSILSGFLFNFFLALFAVCLCSAIGASFCYVLSSLVGQPIIAKYFSQRATIWKAQVQKHRRDLLNYIIFLRITPFLPNWFINITSPIIGVPLGVFFVGTFIGQWMVSPVHLIAVHDIHFFRILPTVVVMDLWLLLLGILKSTRLPVSYWPPPTQTAGVAPPSFLFIRAGTTLYQMTSATGHLSWTSILILGLLAVVSLLPVVFKHTLAKKLT